MNRIWMMGALIALGIAGQPYPIEARASGVALVADVSGQVTLVEKPATKSTDDGAVRLMHAVTAESTLKLAGNARATLFFPATGAAYDLRGPGSFEVGAHDVRAIGGARAAAPRQLNAALRSIRIDRASLTETAMVMRGKNEGEQPDLLAPGMIAPARVGLVFRWSSLGAGREYRFRLIATSGEIVHEARSRALELTLPASVSLAEGERYLWSVLDAAPATRRGPTLWREVVVLTPEQRAEIARLDLGDEPADPAERNLRELLLRQLLARPGVATDRAR